MKNISHSKKISGIYCIKNKKNNNSYIGSSKNIYYRIARHISDLKRNSHGSKILQNAVNKYGIENFEVSILKKCDEKMLLIAEKSFIDTLKPKYNYILDPTDTSRVKFPKRKPSFGNVKPFDHPDKKKWIELYSLQGLFIKRFESYSDAGRFLNLKNPDSLRQWVIKKRRIIHEKYQYKSELCNWDIIDLSDYKNCNIRKKEITVKDLLEDKVYHFKSIKDCSNVLNIALPTISIGCNTNKLIKKRYLISWMK